MIAVVKLRTFGRLGWQVSEVGYGMWGMAGWTGSDDAESHTSLDRAIALGCNFFDTAWAYGDGHSEHLLGATLRRHPGKRLYVATKIPPKNRRWPAKPSYSLDDVFPPDHIREYCERSLENIGVDRIDLLQFHVWSDHWAADTRWQRAVDDLKRENLVEGVGVSINRWQPDNALDALATGLIDAVQVVYNVFDQSPEDRLLPYCQQHDIAVIARVPFDEGSLTGTLTAESLMAGGRFPQPVLHPRKSSQYARARRASASLGSVGHDAAVDDPSPHPRASCCQHGDPRNAARFDTSRRTWR